MSTVGCGLYGRPKWHVIPTHTPNCPTNRCLTNADDRSTVGAAFMAALRGT